MQRFSCAAWACVAAGICGAGRGAAAAPPAAVPAPTASTGAAPRAFGHFIGDRLTRQFEVTVPRAYRLATSGLPQPGRVGAWLELTHLASGRSDTPAGALYRIDLEYQIVGSAPQPMLTVLPAIDLHFVDGARQLERRIDAWPVAIAPLTPAADGAGSGIRAGLEELRPARPPPLIDAAPVERRLLLAGAATAALLGGAAVCAGGLRHRRRPRGPFAAALRTLRELARSAGGTAADAAALRAMHRAFDATFGRRMFAEHIDPLIETHPHFADLRAEAQRFFGLSRAMFFAGGSRSESAPRDWLLQVCGQFAARERRATALRRPR